MSKEFRQGHPPKHLRLLCDWEDPSGWVKRFYDEIHYDWIRSRDHVYTDESYFTLDEANGHNKHRYRPVCKQTNAVLDWESLGAESGQRSYVDMPQIEASTVDEVLVLTDHPRVPQGKRAVAIVLGLDNEQYQPFERFITGSRAAPTLRLGYGEDTTVKVKDAEITALKAQLQTAEAELGKYRAAYDKNPPAELGRFGVLEVD